MKYTDIQIGFSEFPDEISLLINISNCPFHCSGCHSPELWEDIGTELSFEELQKLIDTNKGITCVGFMGGTLQNIGDLAKYIKELNPSLKVGWYIGGNIEEQDLLKDDYNYIDYVKSGPYIEEFGGLNCPSTNQKFYKIEHLNNQTRWLNLTYKFWKK